MGLFEKAASLKTKPSRPEASPPPSAPAPGLLRKTARLLGVKSPVAESQDAVRESVDAPTGDDPSARKTPPDTSEPPEHARAALAAEILRTTTGLQAPGVYLDLLCEKLSVTRAAVLVRASGEDVYVPWAARGFDRTTLRHLRLDHGIIDEATATDHLVIDITGKDRLEEYRRLFSMREFSLIDRIILALVLLEGEVVAVLFVVASDSDPVDADLPEALGQLHDSESGSLFAKREAILSRLLAHPPMDQNSVEDYLGELINTSRERQTPLIVVQIPLSLLLDGVQHEVSSLDRFRLATDLHAVVATLGADIATSRLMAEEETILLFLTDPDSDPQLAGQQITRALHHALALPWEGDPAILPAFRSFPADGETPQDLLAFSGHATNDRAEALPHR